MIHDGLHKHYKLGLPREKKKSYKMHFIRILNFPNITAHHWTVIQQITDICEVFFVKLTAIISLQQPQNQQTKLQIRTYEGKQQDWIESFLLGFYLN